MDELLSRIQELVGSGEFRVSEHGYDELAADDIRVRDVVDGLREATLVEEYPNYQKGSCALVLEADHEGRPIHAVWGIPQGYDSPAVLITGYRPDTDRWDETFTGRLT